jgi:hypothetical protein
MGFGMGTGFQPFFALFIPVLYSISYTYPVRASVICKKFSLSEPTDGSQNVNLAFLSQRL